MGGFTDRVVAVILEIPEGRVATYGQIADLSGYPRAPRQVAGVLKRYSGKLDLPWHRVINSKGIISIKDVTGRAEQMQRLMDEGVEVDAEGRVDLSVYGWRPVLRK